MKFGIGTAQFIKGYGHMNKKIDLFEYFETLNKSKIKMIDTAQLYSNAQKMIGKSLINKKKIVTKIMPLKKIPKNKKLEYFKKNLEKCLKDLRYKKIYGLMLHDENDIFQDDFFYKYIDELKKSRIIKKFGYSTYEIKNAIENKKIYNFNILQAPLNIFDLNTEKIKFMRLVKKNYELHIRSIFLQGVILNNKKLNFKEINQKIFELDKIIKKRKFNGRYQFILSVLKDLKIADYCIIGCLNKSEINDIDNFKYKKTKISDLKKLEVKNKKILDLRKWN